MCIQNPRNSRRDERRANYLLACAYAREAVDAVASLDAALAEVFRALLFGVLACGRPKRQAIRATEAPLRALRSRRDREGELRPGYVEATYSAIACAARADVHGALAAAHMTIKMTAAVVENEKLAAARRDLVSKREQVRALMQEAAALASHLLEAESDYAAEAAHRWRWAAMRAVRTADRREV